MSEQDMRKAEALYLEGKTCKEIAPLFNMSPTGIFFWLKKLGTPLRPAGRRMRSIPMLQKVLNEYHSRVTLRQVFYRLVSAGVIPNTEMAYNTLGKQTVVARRRGEIPYEAFEDRSRDFIRAEWEFTEDTPESIFEAAQETFETAETTFNDAWLNYGLPKWYGQPRHVEVWLEKEALAGVFREVTQWQHVWLAPCKGYPSLTFVYEAANRLHYITRTDPQKEFLILYFGDYDMRGLDMERNMQSNFRGFGIDVSIERIALTKDQIREYNLPPQPCKTHDQMARGWIESEGNVAWELDALPPNVLTKLIREAIERNISKHANDARTKLIADGQERIRKLIEGYNNGTENEGGDI